METKTEGPELTSELIDKAMNCGRMSAPAFVIGALEAVVLDGATKSAAAATLTRFIEGAN